MNGDFAVTHLVPALFHTDEGILGGAERYALELARYMAAEVPTTLVCCGPRNREETMGPLKIRVIGEPHYVRGHRGNPIAWGVLRETGKTPVVHCHQQHVLASSLAAAQSRVTGRRVFVSDLGGGGWDISSYISTDRWYHGHLHISEYSRSVCGHQEQRWAHVIYGGVDTGRFSPDEAVRRTGSALFVGRLMPHKGINDLVNAITPELELDVVGQPYHKQFFEDLKRMAEGKNITFTQGADDTSLVHAYRKAMCIVLPSVYRDYYGGESKVPELLGQTLLEGMACGAPAICTDVASMPEVVVDGVTGFIVPPNNPQALQEKLLWLRNHPEQAREMGLAARRHVLEKFTWPTVVRRCLDIYRS